MINIGYIYLSFEQRDSPVGAGTKHALQALNGGFDLLKTACDEMHSHHGSPEGLRSEMRPHNDHRRHNRLHGRYPVVHLAPKEREHIVLHIQNHLSAVFANGIVAADLGIEAKAGRLVFALTWEDPHTDRDQYDSVRIMVTKEETLRRIRENPIKRTANLGTANLSMEKPGDRYYEDRYHYLANVYLPPAQYVWHSYTHNIVHTIPTHTNAVHMLYGAGMSCGATLPVPLQQKDCSRRSIRWSAM